MMTWPGTQIEIYQSGTVLHYDRGHIEDEFGFGSDATRCR